ncbi:MAG: nicotinate (nicotinamide) nucleotide adenylyltransferase [Ruminococcaceae bacterium]|nr:nicotinate (nicotinamide) nucleotide adenylyltransferase [Oscillospiraceae bacterium]
MANIGIYGGTFNPPHIGHIRAACCAVSALGLQKLLLIPDRIAPHKEMPAGSPTPLQRLEMVRLCAGDDPYLEVTDMELKRDGPSYTYQTVQALKEQYPDDSLYLLIGTDMFLTFRQWKNAEYLWNNVTLGVFYRGQKDEVVAIARHKEEMEALGAKIVLIENPVVDISSTQLRRMLVMDCAGQFLTCEVEEYIRANKLYGTGENYHGLSMERLESVVTELLDPKRVKHVLGCRDTAIALAKHWGADETDAARAALLHDITKALDGKLQLTLCREYGIILDTFFTKNPKTLHALTGSLVAARIFGENEAVVSAIRSHTTGKAAMNTLEKIIYVADYMEPNRDFPGVEELRKLAFTDLDGAMKLGLEMTLTLLEKQGSEISPESREALAYLNKSL